MGPIISCVTLPLAARIKKIWVAGVKEASMAALQVVSGTDLWPPPRPASVVARGLQVALQLAQLALQVAYILQMA
jgi:hypothetical protein